VSDGDSWLLGAEDLWARRYLSDGDEAELERLEFLERTAGLDSSDVFPRRIDEQGDE